MFVLTGELFEKMLLIRGRRAGCFSPLILYAVAFGVAVRGLKALLVRLTAPRIAMWPFKRNNAPDDWFETVERLERRIQKVEEEWTDVYGKFRRLQMRAAKQVQRAEELEESQAAGTAETGGGNDDGSIPLTPRQRTIQQQILERRRKLGG